MLLLFCRLLLRARKVPLHALFGCMRCCYSAACYSRPARFRCTPYSAACDAAIPRPAIPGLRSSAARLIWLHAMLLFCRLLLQAHNFRCMPIYACDALSQPSQACCNPLTSACVDRRESTTSPSLLNFGVPRLTHRVILSPSSWVSRARLRQAP